MENAREQRGEGTRADAATRHRASAAPSGADPTRPLPERRDARTRTRDELLARAMERFGDAVYRTALSRTASAADAEDVFQDAFARLYRSDATFNDDEHMKAWLLRVTINRCCDLAREAWTRRRAPYDTGSFRAIPDPNPDAAPDAPFASAGPDGFDALAAVAALPADQRDAVHLFYVEVWPTSRNDTPSISTTKTRTATRCRGFRAKSSPTKRTLSKCPKRQRYSRSHASDSAHEVGAAMLGGDRARGRRSM